MGHMQTVQHFISSEIFTAATAVLPVYDIFMCNKKNASSVEA